MRTGMTDQGGERGKMNRNEERKRMQKGIKVVEVTGSG